MHERLSYGDGTILASHAEHIQRYEFALEYCKGKRVLDAGCGTGYGSYFLAANGAASVVALDISEEALAEARKTYPLENLEFRQHDVERLAADPSLVGNIDVIVNFENLEHVPHPDLLIAGAAHLLRPVNGLYISSTPNGVLSERDEHGKPTNRFHVEEYTHEQLHSMVGKHFGEMADFGQWLTHAGRLRKIRAQQTFDQLIETYYNPMCRIGRAIKRMVGKAVAPPPQLTSGMDHYPGDHRVLPLASLEFPWLPEVLIVVCRQPK